MTSDDTTTGADDAMVEGGEAMVEAACAAFVGDFFVWAHVCQPEDIDDRHCEADHCMCHYFEDFDAEEARDSVRPQMRRAIASLTRLPTENREVTAVEVAKWRPCPVCKYTSVLGTVPCAQCAVDAADSVEAETMLEKYRQALEAIRAKTIGARPMWSVEVRDIVNAALGDA